MMLDLAYSESKIVDLVFGQLSNFFPGICAGSDREQIAKAVPPVLMKAECCFSKVVNKYYRVGTNPHFSPLHSAQNTMFLYWLSHELGVVNGAKVLGSQVYYLNKVLNSVDIYFEVSLPDIMFCEHPLGSVMGRAVYGDYFTFYQGCTVGGNWDNYPKLGEYVTMFSNCSILGDSTIGNHVVVSAGTLIKDQNIPDNSIVFGKSPELVIRSKDAGYFEELESGLWMTGPHVQRGV